MPLARRGAASGRSRRRSAASARSSTTVTMPRARGSAGRNTRCGSSRPHGAALGSQPGNAAPRLPVLRSLAVVVVIVLLPYGAPTTAAPRPGAGAGRCPSPRSHGARPAPAARCRHCGSAARRRRRSSRCRTPTTPPAAAASAARPARRAHGAAGRDGPPAVVHSRRTRPPRRMSSSTRAGNAVSSSTRSSAAPLAPFTVSDSTRWSHSRALAMSASPSGAAMPANSDTPASVGATNTPNARCSDSAPVSSSIN